MSRKRTMWHLYESDTFVEAFTSHNKAKRAMHERIKESIENSLHTHYEVKKVKVIIDEQKEEPMWKKAGFKTASAYWDWYDEFCDDVRHGYI